jgi:hypothetical protein
MSVQQPQQRLFADDVNRGGIEDVAADSHHASWADPEQSEQDPSTSAHGHWVYAHLPRGEVNAADDTMAEILAPKRVRLGR